MHEINTKPVAFVLRRQSFRESLEHSSNADERSLLVVAVRESTILIDAFIQNCTTLPHSMYLLYKEL